MSSGRHVMVEVAVFLWIILVKWHLEVMNKMFKFQVVNSEQETRKRWELTPEGEQVAEKGSHEALVFHSVPAEGGMLQADLMVSNFTKYFGS